MAEKFDDFSKTSGKKSGTTMIAIVVLALLIVGAIVAVVMTTTKMHSELEQQKLANEQLQLTNEQLQLANEYQVLNTQYAQYENQSQLLANDSLVTKYAAAKSKVEKLLQELKNEKQKSSKRIKQLQDEIGTLKNILRHYVSQIDSLGKENAALRDENAEIKQRNQQLSSRVESQTKRVEALSERMVLAEKLNVTGVQLIGLKKNGKTEKNITKAKQLEVTFTIPQNNSTPVGEKTIYLRITSPEGTLLGAGGSFSFEGSSLQCTARKTIEYAGEEIGGVKIYWDVNTALTPGDYLVGRFADNYRLASRKFTMRK